ncbi:hypothetical protein [Nocardia nova]
MPMAGNAQSTDAGCTCREKATRRIVVYFEGAESGNEITLEYAATYIEAREFAAAALANGLAITVDRKVRPNLRPLPCRRLWH